MQRQAAAATAAGCDGRVTLTGSLSEKMVTLGLCLRISGRSSHWFREVATGTAGVFLPGDGHNALYAAGSLYAAVTLSGDRLEEEAARHGLVLDRRTLGGTGLVPSAVPLGVVSRIRRRVESAHTGSGAGSRSAGEMLLRVLIVHNAREPRHVVGQSDLGGHARTVARACSYISQNLSEPISIDDVAAAAFTSRRTLHRAFLSSLDETPQSCVRRLRLHRIRRDLASETEAGCTVALVANQWGVSHLGRLPGWYRELFGELPSETLSARRSPGSRAA